MAKKLRPEEWYIEAGEVFTIALQFRPIFGYTLAGMASEFSEYPAIARMGEPEPWLPIFTAEAMDDISGVLADEVFSIFTELPAGPIEPRVVGCRGENHEVILMCDVPQKIRSLHGGIEKAMSRHVRSETRGELWLPHIPLGLGLKARSSYVPTESIQEWDRIPSGIAIGYPYDAVYFERLAWRESGAEQMKVRA
jgi:hypothetical protein